MKKKWGEDHDNDRDDDSNENDIWLILHSVNKMCVWGPKTRNIFWVIATELFCQIWWLMSLSKRNDPFVMHNVKKSSWNYFKSFK